MNLELSDEQRMLADMVERFTLDHYDIAKRAKYQKSNIGYSQKNWNLMAETGILSIPFSDEYDGLNGTASDMSSVMKPLGRAVAVEPILACIALSGHFLNSAGTASQKKIWIPRMMKGEACIGLAHSEHQSRFDLGFVRTTFKAAAEKVKITGHKTFVLGAGAADAYIVSAVEKDADPDNKVSMKFFIVDANAPNLRIRKYRLIDGSVACELELNDTPGELMDGGFQKFLKSVSFTKIAACAEMVGLMEILFETTLEHVKIREQFGRPLAKFQVIQHRLSDIYAELEMARSHLINLVAVKPFDLNYHKVISGSKAAISKSAVMIAEEAVQLHGGMGISDELIIGHALKRVKLLTILFGDADAEMRRYGLAA